MWAEFCDTYAPTKEKKEREENIDKTTIDLNMGISKSNGEEFTTQELAQFLNDYIEWIEGKGLVSGGSCGFVREEN